MPQSATLRFPRIGVCVYFVFQWWLSCNKQSRSLLQSLMLAYTYIRTGEKREMKFALESYWAKKSTEQELSSVGKLAAFDLSMRGMHA